MKFLLPMLTLLILALIFGLVSFSQSYAAARQAQAVIEASQAAQIASTGNLVIIATLSILLMVAMGIISYLVWRPHPVSRPDASWGQADVHILPILLTALLYQVLQQQSPIETSEALSSLTEQDDTALFDEEDSRFWILE